MMGATLLKGDTWPIAKLAIFFETNTMLDQKTSKENESVSCVELLCNRFV